MASNIEMLLAKIEENTRGGGGGGASAVTVALTIDERYMGTIDASGPDLESAMQSGTTVVLDTRDAEGVATGLYNLLAVEKLEHYNDQDEMDGYQYTASFTQFVFSGVNDELLNSDFS